MKNLAAYLFLILSALMATPGMADNQAVPNIFATQSGSVPASQLDVNFATVLDAGANRITATGSANTYIAVSNPAITAYITNQPFIVSFPANNTGASTINFNGIGSTYLKKVISSGETALVSGDIVASVPYVVLGDGTGYIIANPSSSVSVPVATSSSTGVVQPDGTIITVDGSGHITVPNATSTVFGVVEPDNSTITASGGVLTSHAAAGLVTPLAVGSFATLQNNTGTLISAGTATSYADLKPVEFGGGNFQGPTDAIAGTWKPMQTVDNGYVVIWQRTN